jgi:hypothetical protein
VIGPVEDDAGPGVLDAVWPLIGTDPVVVDGDCWFPGAVGGYNAVALTCNATARWEKQPGVTEVVVSVNYKGSCEEVTRRIAEENGVRLDYLYSE